MKTKLISRLGYKEFYNNSDSIEKLLKHIHLDTALEFLVLINKNEHVLNQDENSEIRFILREWIPDTSEDFKTNFLTGNHLSTVDLNKVENQAKLIIVRL